MFDNQVFQQLVEADHLTGEVIATNSFIVEVKGLEGVRLGAQVLFEDGQHGLVRETYGDRVILFNMNSEFVEPGTLVVVEKDLMQIPVGDGLIGRVVSPLGEPLDGKGPISTSQTSGIFNAAPGIMDRTPLKDQLESGVSFVDSFFPVVLGQRIAILGDSKAGKSSFLTQLTMNQKGSGHIVVYTLIGKRKVDIETLLTMLEKSGAMEHTIVVIANIFDSLTLSYLAPYAACAMAEALWHAGRDTVIIYDDLSSHAEAYRQLSLLQEVDPGRDSYPGDMFYAHSSLLERAGKLLDGGHTLTALPVVMTPNNDITAFLPTAIMSITDGQIILDLNAFRKGVRPAVNAGLSVSRVGGQSQTKRAKLMTGTLVKKLAAYRRAEEFTHFGSSMSAEFARDLQLGKTIYEVLLQPPEELFTLTQQQLMLQTVLKGNGEVKLDVAALKQSVKQYQELIVDDAELDRIEGELLPKHTIPEGPAKLAEAPAEPPANAITPPAEPTKADKRQAKADRTAAKEEAKTHA